MIQSTFVGSEQVELGISVRATEYNGKVYWLSVLSNILRVEYIMDKDLEGSIEIDMNDNSVSMTGNVSYDMLKLLNDLKVMEDSHKILYRGGHL